MRASLPSSVALRHEPTPISITSLQFPSRERPGDSLDHGLDAMVDELSRIATSASSADAAAHFDALLRRVGRSLCRVFRLTRCSVYLTSDAVTFRGLVGFDASSRLDTKVRAKVVDVASDPVTAELVRTQAPVVVADARTDGRAVASVVRRLGIRDLVAVPLVADDVVIGAVYLDDAGRDHHYSPADVARAASLARRAAALVRHAQVVLGLRRRLDRAGEERQLLERATRGQLSVDAAALEGACATHVVDHVSEALNRPVLLVGPAHELLHVAGTDRDVDGELRASWRPGAFARHAAARLGSCATVLPPDPRLGLMTRQLVSPIARSSVHTSVDAPALVALEIGRRFDESDRRVLDRAAAVIRLAPDPFESPDPRSRDRPSFGVLSAPGVEEHVGFPAVVVWVDRGAAAVVRHLGVRLALPGDRAVIVPHRAGAGVVIPAADAGPAVDALRELLGEAGPRVAVVSRAALDLDDLAAACAEVDTLATMLEHNGVGDRIVSIDQLGGARHVLASSTPDAVARLVGETLPPLMPRAIGARLSDALLATARMLVATDGSIREAANRLVVHENTVRYRARRVRELTGLDVTAVGDLFRLQVALCAWEQLGFDPA